MLTIQKFLRCNSRHKTINLFRTFVNKGSKDPPSTPKINAISCLPDAPKEPNSPKCKQMSSPPTRKRSVFCVPPLFSSTCCTSPKFFSKKWPRTSPPNVVRTPCTPSQSTWPGYTSQQCLSSGVPPECSWPGFCECRFCMGCQCCGQCKKFDASACGSEGTKYNIDPIPYNPCCPGPGGNQRHNDQYKKYKNVFFAVLPIILIFTLYVMGGEEPDKKTCRQYEFMRRRTKRFPWGEGNKTFYHNDHTNYLPEECEPPPDCE